MALSARQLHKLQIDNQLYVTPYPVLLEPLGGDRTETVQFTMMRQASQPAVHFIRTCKVLVRELH